MRPGWLVDTVNSSIEQSRYERCALTKSLVVGGQSNILVKNGKETEPIFKANNKFLHKMANQDRKLALDTEKVRAEYQTLDGGRSNRFDLSERLRGCPKTAIKSSMDSARSDASSVDDSALRICSRRWQTNEDRINIKPYSYHR